MQPSMRTWNLPVLKPKRRDQFDERTLGRVVSLSSLQQVNLRVMQLVKSFDGPREETDSRGDSIC